MAKKSRTAYTSKGERVSVSLQTRKDMRADRSYLDKRIAQYAAHAKGKKTSLDADETKSTAFGNQKGARKAVEAK